METRKLSCQKKTLIEKRRRISDQDKRQLSIIMTLGGFLVAIAIISTVLLNDYRRFETTFQQTAVAIEHSLKSQIRENEAVLEGFAAFLSGKAELNHAQAAGYAKKIRERFPHIFMLEIAEGVSAEELPSLIERQKKQGFGDYEVKVFSYTGDRHWKPLPDKSRYYPLVFLSPLPEESRQVLGLDISSHKHLHEPLLQALSTGSYQTSLPFRLVEGENAYVMFMPANGPEETNNREDGQFIVLIVLLTDRVIEKLSPLIDDTMGILIYHNAKSKVDTGGHLYSLAPAKGLPLFQATYDVELETGRSGFALCLEKRLWFTDISWSLILLSLFTALVIFIRSRRFILKRYSRDIEWAKDEARLQLLASRDTLTELPNRHLLVAYLRSRTDDSDEEIRMAMIFLDLDRFKAINDQYGHRMGDVLLQEVARRIQHGMRKDDMAYRLGGDEFVIVVREYASTDNVNEIAEKLRTQIEKPYHIEGRSISVGVSIGIALYPEDTTDILDLLHYADKAMYLNKAERNEQSIEPERSEIIRFTSPPPT